MRRAACPGSFDPVTHGHLDVIERAASLFDEVVVAVGNNMSKSGLFTPAERVEMLTHACVGWPGVSVSLFDGLLVDFCREGDIGAIVKGLRSAADFDHELQMAHMNQHLSGVETVFLPTGRGWSYVSSTLIREIAALGGDIADFVPRVVAERMAERVREQRSA